MTRGQHNLSAVNYDRRGFITLPTFIYIRSRWPRKKWIWGLPPPQFGLQQVGGHLLSAPDGRSKVLGHLEVVLKIFRHYHFKGDTIGQFSKDLGQKLSFKSCPTICWLFGLFGKHLCCYFLGNFLFQHLVISQFRSITILTHAMWKILHW